MDEGYVKYRAKWINEPIDIDSVIFEELNYWRAKYFEKGWIGMYPDGIGFGNISCRLAENRFLISGSATGGIQDLIKEHYSIVEDYSLSSNWLQSKGQTAASSESLSHAALYENKKNVRCIIHIHNMAIWQKWKDKLPTTLPSIAYGTPQMAMELQKRQNKIEAEIGLIIMAGHKEGVIAYGSSHEQLYKALLSL